jgi:hypothetical protein
VHGLTSGSASVTFRIKSAGGKFKIPSFDGFKGNGLYETNNAPHTAKLTLTNSGTTNPLGAPTPAYGSPVLYMEASLKGALYVTFQNAANNIAKGTSPPAHCADRIDRRSRSGGSAQGTAYLRSRSWLWLLLARTRA